ncbi:polyprenyl synthetase family protein [Wolbachia endosymbiont of Dipetalonema caudispina]|uniref:polyprenyl synthetase family protein n=1 Tax=Wolbachia endosymbiont of Dipetalonema caudispina TaxID=1812112 RepID=UPI001589CBD7|nr:polyprenyl synthetase family protein [Wolbachia endosymbiont of Dipetalonema caudispina]MCV3769345.1 polyprenyl synthetase family protein [Wolbachia pipientis]QKX00790.1 polyprenyl synthetase family protein [Wolbachia endosymbiont of Dipetalonema caudispina]
MLDKSMKNLLIAEIDKILPENSQNRLVSAMRYMLFAPTKYMRSFLIMASSQVFDVRAEKVILVAVAVECIHTYSLIHDDLPCMDNSDIRRNQLSCHKKFDEATAVLAGDALLTLAFEILSSLNENSHKRCEIIKVLSQAIGSKGMVGGQVLDISKDFSKIKEIHLMKTAKLLAASCEIGAIIGDATNKERKALYNYGINLGLIFQAGDDIKDYKQDKVNNLIFVFDESDVKDYIDKLCKQALNSISKLPGNTHYLYNLLNQIKKDG